MVASSTFCSFSKGNLSDVSYGHHKESQHTLRESVYKL